MKTLISIIAAILITVSLQAQVNYQNNSVTGSNASALGTDNTSSGQESFGSGKGCLSSGNQSISLGLNTEATGTAAVSLGAYNYATGNSSVSIGSRSYATQTGSIAIGNKIKSNATFGYVIGYGITDNYLENNINNSLMIGFQSNVPTLYVGPGNGSINSIGKVGIGTTSPSKMLDVSGTFNANGEATFGNNVDVAGTFNADGVATFGDNADISGNLTVNGTSTTNYATVNNKTVTSQLQVTSGAAAGKILQSDADGNASWTDPMALNVDDGDWEFESGTNNIFRSSGNVGIGTNSPDYDLHIASDIGSVDHTFLRISNENYSAGGSFSIGKEEGNGPVLIQRSGNIAFVDTLGNITGYPRVSILQKSKNGQTGMMLSTYTGPSGDVNYVDLQAPESDMYIRTLNNLIFRTGENKTERMRITQSGNVGIGKIPSSAYKLDVAGDVNISGQLNVKKISKLTVDFLTVTKKIDAAEIEVKKIPEWKDCVFDENYNLRSLKDVEQYIKKHGHLPDIPGESEVLQDGINLAEMNALLLQKIEELTLYVIELEKKIENDDR